MTRTLRQASDRHRLALRVAAIAICALAVAARPAPARACSFGTMSLFEQFELATDVAVIDGVADQVPGAKTVVARVNRRLKGAMDPDLWVQVEPCWNVPTRGTALVFLAPGGMPIGPRGVMFDPSVTLMNTLVEWMVAADKTAADRARVLVAILTSPQQRSLHFDAAFYLSNAPGELRVLTDAQVAELEALRDDVQVRLPITIVIARHHGASWRRLRRSREVRADPDLAALAAYDFERITDPARLARIIDARTSNRRKRTAAFERCERVHGVQLARFGMVPSGGEDWAPWATACRTGEPIR